MKWLSLFILYFTVCSNAQAKHKSNQKFTVKLQSGWDRLAQVSEKPRRKLLPKLGKLDALGKLTGGLIGTSTEELALMNQQDKLSTRHRVLSSSLASAQSDARRLIKAVRTKVEGLNSLFDSFEANAVSQMIRMNQRALVCIAQMKGQEVSVPEERQPNKV